MDQKQYAIWTGFAGLLFMIVGIHDLLMIDSIDKSKMAIAFELIAGFAFMLNALITLRKRNQ